MRYVVCVMFNGVKMRSLTKSMDRTPDNVVMTSAPTTYIYHPAILPSVDNRAAQQGWRADLVVVQKLFAKLVRGTQISKISGDVQGAVILLVGQVVAVD